MKQILNQNGTRKIPLSTQILCPTLCPALCPTRYTKLFQFFGTANRALPSINNINEHTDVKKVQNGIFEWTGLDGWALNVLCCLRYQSCYGSTVPTRKTWHFVQTRHMRASSCREAAAGRPAGHGSMSARQCFCALQRCGTSSPHPPPHACSSWRAWEQQIVTEVCVVAGLASVIFINTRC